MAGSSKQPIRNYRDLVVWQESLELVVECHRATKSFPKTEVYGLVSQIHRAASSIPANIAEGHGRDHLGDYLRHLSFAKGSLAELETHPIVSFKLEFLVREKLASLLSKTAEIEKMLEALSRSLKAKVRESLEPET